MVDWGAGNYEATAAELAPVAHAVVERAQISPGDDVIDLACGTGNAALAAAARGAHVVGVDGAPRLLEVARRRAREHGVVVDFRHGDLLALPVDADAGDVVLSVFGVVFAHDPDQALHEVGRVLRPFGRALVTAWIPGGPIDEMLTAMGRIVSPVSSTAPAKRFPWSDPAAVASSAAGAGLTLQHTARAALPIRAASPEAYFAAGQEHPVAVAMRGTIEQAHVEAEVREAALCVLHHANEDPDAFLVHSPYVVHELSGG